MPCSRRVLVLDGMWNKSLAAVRSFGEKGFYVAAGETTVFSTALFSRYVSKRHVYPSPKTRPDDFMEWLLDELKAGGYDLVLPTEFSTQQLISRHAEEIRRHAGFPFPEAGLAEKAHDKAWLMRFADSKGYLVPKTRFTDEGSVDEVEAIGRDLTYPAVIKPVGSSGSRGIAYVYRKEDFKDAYLKVHAKYPCPIVQEYIPPASGGGGFGVGVLFNMRSEPRAAFVYRRLREYPVTGGPSTLRESVKNDAIRDTAVSLLKDLGWAGPAMVEFKVDPRDGRARLLEVNPRLWGSLMLPIIAGVDFPYLLYRLAVEGDIEPVKEYRTGVKCRWLIPGDIMHLFSSPVKIKALRGMFARSDGDDILSLKDPMPTVGRISSLIPLIFNKEMRGVLSR